MFKQPTLQYFDPNDNISAVKLLQLFVWINIDNKYLVYPIIDVFILYLDKINKGKLINLNRK